MCECDGVPMPLTEGQAVDVRFRRLLQAMPYFLELFVPTKASVAGNPSAKTHAPEAAGAIDANEAVVALTALSGATGDGDRAVQAAVPSADVGDLASLDLDFLGQLIMPVLGQSGPAAVAEGKGAASSVSAAPAPGLRVVPRPAEPALSHLSFKYCASLLPYLSALGLCDAHDAFGSLCMDTLSKVSDVFRRTSVGRAASSGGSAGAGADAGSPVLGARTASGITGSGLARTILERSTALHAFTGLFPTFQLRNLPDMSVLESPTNLIPLFGPIALNLLPLLPSSLGLKRKCRLCDAPESRAASRRRLVGLHPCVPVDMSGAPLFVCETCHELIISRRAHAAERRKCPDAEDGYEDICAVCGTAPHAAQRYPEKPEALFVCSARCCPRSYCATCLDILLDSRQRALMHAEPEWLCPPCATVSKPFLTSSGVIGPRKPASFFESRTKEAMMSEGSASTSISARKSTGKPSGRRSSATPAQPSDKSSLPSPASKPALLGSPTAAGSAKPPSKPIIRVIRRNQGTVAASSSEAMDPEAQAKGVLRIFCNYAGLVRQREEKPSVHLAEGTEDECFFCLDGGDLVLCDCEVPDSGTKNKGVTCCSKCYHRECLAAHGYVAPKDLDWFCPRHFCMTCAEEGSQCIAAIVCRYCPKALCARHHAALRSSPMASPLDWLPLNTDLRAPPPDLPKYVAVSVCPGCAQLLRKGTEEKLLPRTRDEAPLLIDLPSVVTQAVRRATDSTGFTTCDEPNSLSSSVAIRAMASLETQQAVTKSPEQNESTRADPSVPTSSTK
jgi:hypothetical protein